MKNKLLILLIITLSILCLFSCGGKDNDTDNSQNNGISDGKATVNVIDGEESSSIDFEATIGNVLPTINKKGYTFLGYYSRDGVKYFNENGVQAEGLMLQNGMSLYAKLEPYKYTIKVNAQSGQFEDASKLKEYTVSYSDSLASILPVAVSTNPKFELDGYYDERGEVKLTNGKEPLFTLDDYENGAEICLYAKFKIKEFTITVNFNDGVSWDEKFTVKYGDPIGDLSSYIRDTGSEVITSFSASSVMDLPISDSITADTTIYAVWSKYKEVEFVYPDGIKKETILYTQGKSTTLPNEDAPGYKLLGWYANEAYIGNPIVNEPYGALKNKYYGKWEPISYTMSFDTDGGEAIEDITYYYNQLSPLPTLTKKGYNFAGWSYKGSEPFSKIPENMYGDATVNAVWTPKEYTILLNPNYSGAVYYSSSVLYGQVNQLIPPKREGYDFIGWYSKSENGIRLSNNDGKMLDTWLMEEEITMYAYWEIAKHTVSYVSNGAGEFGTQYYTYGDKLSLPENVSKENAIFLGWYDESLSIKYSNGALVTENMTLYGKWIESTPISSATDFSKLQEKPFDNYHLTNDIDFNFGKWLPIDGFSGYLDGRGFKISNMKLEGNDGWLSMFYANNGTIKDLSFENVELNCTYTGEKLYCGIIACKNEASGVIENCKLLSGKITFSNYTNEDSKSAEYIYSGTICAINNGLINSTCSFVNIDGSLKAQSDYAYSYVGGLVGVNNAYISSCYTEQEINLNVIDNKNNNHYYLYTGGMIGRVESDNSECTRSYACSEIRIDKSNPQGNVYPQVGGFIGRDDKGGAITECYSSGNIYASSKGESGIHIGGFAGYLYSSKISNCYTDTKIIAVGGYAEVGGFVGRTSNAKIKNCIVNGAVSTERGRIGTIVAYSGSSGVSYCITTIKGSIYDYRDMSTITENASVNDYTIEELFDEELFHNELLFSRDIWVTNGKIVPVLKWHTEIEE